MTDTPTPTTPTPVSWDQLKGESDRAYRGFRDYAELGPARSLRDLHQRYVKQKASAAQANSGVEKPPTDKASTIFTWSVRHHWQDRVKGWDNNEKRLRLIEHEAAVKEMSRKHVQQAQVLAQSLMLPALEFLRRAQRNPDLIQSLSIGDLTTLMVRGARIVPHVQKAERLAMGEPETLLEIWSLSDEELINKYKNLLDQIRGGSGLEAAALDEPIDDPELLGDAGEIDDLDEALDESDYD